MKPILLFPTGSNSDRTSFFCRVLSLIAGLMTASAPLIVGAAVTGVNVGDDYFSPSSVTINVNDQIMWTWVGSLSHSSTSDSSLWDSGINGNGFSYTRSFTTAGTFPYHCRVHSFQTGTIKVLNPSVSVSIINPANGATFNAPASFVLRATASTPSGTITNVSFLRGANLLGNDTTAPYTTPVNDLPVGNYTFSARASDSQGRKATNSIVVHVVPDVTRPTVTLVAPVGLQRITNTVLDISLKGMASDNVRVTNVQVQLNGGSWGNATTGNGWSNWTAQVTPIAGTNTYRAFSQDTSGNRSLTNQARFIYVVPSTLTLITNGTGGISRAFAGLTLEVGRAYTVAGVPGPGQIFSDWSGDISSESATLTFIMQPNMTLQANFVPNPFLAAKGVYNGLFSEQDRAQARSGFFTMSLGDHGAYSASVRRGTNTYSWTGQFDASGTTTTAVTMGGTLFSVSLSLNFADNQTLTGTIGLADLVAYRSVFNSVTNQANLYAGKYTAIIPGLTDASVGPGGNGFVTVVVGPGGNATISGLSGDGKTISKIVPLSSGGAVPFYQDLYAGAGSMWGWLMFDTNQPNNHIGGLLSWIKPVVPGAVLYPLGFTNNVQVVGSRYFQPAAGNPVIGLTDGVVIFEGGNLAGRFTNAITLTANNKVINGSPNFLSFNITVTNGTFSGSVKVPGTTKTNTFKGAFLQDSDAGYGEFLGTSQSGSVSVQAQ